MRVTVGSENLHERFEDVTDETRDMHRAIVSLMEELEAIDWYQQRVDATKNEALKEVLGHNRDEEIEHAMMNLEWIRRHHPTFDEHARTYLFSQGPITAVEEVATGAGGGGGGSDSDDSEEGAKASGTSSAGRGGGGSGSGGGGGGTPKDGSLGIGSLKIA